MNSKKSVAVVLVQFVILSLFTILLLCSLRETGAQAESPRPESPAQKALDQLLLGSWDVSNPLVPDTRYVFTNSSGRRSVTVQERGRAVASHDFQVLAEDTIQITGSAGEARKGMQFTEKEMKDIIHLKRPPKQLRFSRTAPAPFSSRKRPGTLFVYGIFAGLPVPMDKVIEKTQAPESAPPASK